MFSRRFLIIPLIETLLRSSSSKKDLEKVLSFLYIVFHFYKLFVTPKIVINKEVFLQQKNNTRKEKKKTINNNETK